ncbi:MAG: signal recognition particle receptor subunit alpha, partial [Burkholderiales bacterium]|nr:signal recognition particle receptor subunit alpha [Opitutaceae bacterium]
MFGLFKKFKDGLAKTVAAISAKTHSLFGGRRIDASSIEELEEALITADFGVETTNEILTEIKTAYRKDPQLAGKQAAEIGAAVLTRVLAGSAGSPSLVKQPNGMPAVIVMIGVNGSGKTTTTAKLAWALQEEGKSVLVAACDTFRAAAVEQLKAWAERLKLDVVASHTGADAAAVAYDALQAGKSRGKDVV